MEMDDEAVKASLRHSLLIAHHSAFTIVLTELRIANFALIDRVSIEFSPGFHVLTGETGAGKSVVVDALALLVGGRATTDHIRTEADEAILEAAFALPPSHPLLPRLREQGVLRSDETELIVRRVLSRSGRHRIYVNGALTPLHVLQSLAGTLVDILGQHEQQSLLVSAAQLEAVDAFGRLTGLRDEYGGLYRDWWAARRALEDEERTVLEGRAREELLRFQYRELTDAALQPGEDDALAAERQRLSHGRRLGELIEEAYAMLYDHEPSLLGDFKRVSDCLKSLGQIDATAGDLVSLSESAGIQLRELVHRVRLYREGLEHDPDRLATVEERLDRLQRLKKKYGETVDGLLFKCGRLKEELAVLTSSEERLVELRARVAETSDRLRSTAARLSAGRRRAAGSLAKRVKKELAALRMDHTEFVVDVQNSEETWGPTGGDRVEFLLSANPGEPLLPLTKVASGGELSRLMLAMKSVLAETDTVPVLVFDEIDAGVGGAVATAMGQRLRELGRHHQVLAITHLPQVASLAESHWLVDKSVIKGRTATRVVALDAVSRREEIARMVAGSSITTAVRKTADEMIRDAEGR